LDEKFDSGPRSKRTGIIHAFFTERCELARSAPKLYFKDDISQLVHKVLGGKSGKELHIS